MRAAFIRFRIGRWFVRARSLPKRYRGAKDVTDRRLVVFRVIDVDGRPLAGVPLAVASASAPVPERGIATGDDGRAAIALPFGRASIQAILPDGLKRQVEILVSGNEDAEITIGR
jgi:hypothetical protein